MKTLRDFLLDLNLFLCFTTLKNIYLNIYLRIKKVNRIVKKEIKSLILIIRLVPSVIAL